MERVDDRCCRPVVGLLGASFATTNLGVAALASGAISSVFHFCPDAKVFLLDYGEYPSVYHVRHPGGMAGVELVNIRFSKRFYLSNNIAFLLFLAFCIRILPSCRLKTHLEKNNAALRAIREADVICSLAGGDSFSDIYGFRRFIYVTLPQLLVLLMNEPLVLLPQTIGPFKSSFARSIARAVIRGAKAVYTRDPGGTAAACELAGVEHEKVRFAHDMGFALEPYISSHRIPSWLAAHDGKIPLVGLNVSGLLYMGGYTKDNMFGLKADYRRLLQRLIVHFIGQGARVMLVPHVFRTGEGSESDIEACSKVFEESEAGTRERLHLLNEEYDQHEIKALIGRCDFFLGSRMHACIAAMSQCVPAVGLAYSRKFQGVFESVGMKDQVIDLRKCSEDEVVDTIERAYQSRAECRAKLETEIPAVRASVLGLFRQIWNSSEFYRDARGKS